MIVGQLKVKWKRCEMTIKSECGKLAKSTFEGKQLMSMDARINREKGLDRIRREKGEVMRHSSQCSNEPALLPKTKTASIIESQRLRERERERRR
jgi:hypothetical protein